MPVSHQIAAELQVRPAQVEAAVALLDGGATVPFIARYRKEATGGLDDTQLRELEQRLTYLRELHARREVVLASIDEQGKLTPALREALLQAATKQVLEDLYLPYKPRRRTKAAIAREAGLEPLADRLWADLGLEPLAEAAAFVNAEAGFAHAPAVLDGVRDLLSERWAEDAALVGNLREWLWGTGMLRSRLVAGQDASQAEVARFRDYFEHDEPIARMPSHRALAVFRGRAQGCLDVRLAVDDPAAPGEPTLSEGRIARHLGWRASGRPGDAFVRRAVAWTWKVKLSLSLERDLFTRLREQAQEVAIRVFGDNLRDLLLAAPAGRRVVMGLDPGVRTGVKVAVVSETGRVLDTTTVYPHEPRRDWEGSLAALGRLVARHGVSLVAVGNGTASRETDKLAGELLQRVRAAAPAHRLDKVIVSEAGASVYSASELASQELPELDVSLRGAVSIARRLQDPLAELVKIDPKSIGVGQYQHDLEPGALARQLDGVVESCVNNVGVDLNTASVPLLRRVSGLSASVAEGIVRWRDANGSFRSRRQLLDVPGLGPRTFEQAAGFLRIREGDDPLDMTGVHPETYPLVQRLLEAAGRPITAVMGKPEVLRTLRPEAFADACFGAVTVRDILAELEKPGRDPRPGFEVARHQEGVHELADLKPGMRLEGTVTNVAQFGAFIDIGVHQDGLVHVSQLADRYVADAREVVRAGQVVQVRVVEVDLQRRRIALSMRAESSSAAPAGGAGENRFRPAARGERVSRPATGTHPGPAPAPSAAGTRSPGADAGAQGAMAAAFSRLQQRSR